MRQTRRFTGKVTLGAEPRGLIKKKKTKNKRLLRRQTIGGSKIQTDGKAGAEPKIGNSSHVLRRTWIPAKDEKMKSGETRVTDGGEELLAGLLNWERVLENSESHNNSSVLGNRGSVPCSCDLMSQG